MTRLRPLALCVLAALALDVSLAAARETARLSRNDDADPPEGYQSRLSAATGLLCVKQCPNDDLPCDPPAFKVADGRCTTQWR